MHLLLVKSKGESLRRFKKILDKRGFDYDTLDLDVKDESLIQQFCSDLYKEKAEIIDGVFFFIEDWYERKTLLGRMYNKYFSSYLVSFVRLRNGYEKTADHELMHMLDNWVYTYLGISLANIIGVNNWDTDFVHAKDDRFVEYEYDEVYEKVRLYVSSALQKRKKLSVLSLQEKLLVMLRQQVLMLTKQTHSINQLIHPVDGYKEYISQPYGVYDKRYTLTQHHIGCDYATPVNTHIVAPWQGEMTVSGYSNALGYFCHYKYTYEGKIYTARFSHLSKQPKTGKYSYGDILGYTGNTGMSTGPHVHIDVWYGDVDLTIINPKNWDKLTIDPKIHYGT